MVLSSWTLAQEPTPYDVFAEEMAKKGLAAPLGAAKGDMVLTFSGGFSGQVTMFFRSESRNLSLVFRAYPPTKTRKLWAVLVLAEGNLQKLDFKKLGEFPDQEYESVEQTADDGLEVILSRWSEGKEAMYNVNLSNLKGIERNELYQRCFGVSNKLKFPKNF